VEGCGVWCLRRGWLRGFGDSGCFPRVRIRALVFGWRRGLWKLLRRKRQDRLWLDCQWRGLVVGLRAWLICAVRAAWVT